VCPPLQVGHAVGIGPRQAVASVAEITDFPRRTWLKTPFLPSKGRSKAVSILKRYSRDPIVTEFRWYGGSNLIKESRYCDHFEDRNPVYDEEDSILRF
jgi:hypothetical protein